MLRYDFKVNKAARLGSWTRQEDQKLLELVQTHGAGASLRVFKGHFLKRPLKEPR